MFESFLFIKVESFLSRRPKKIFLSRIGSFPFIYKDKKKHFPA